MNWKARALVMGARSEPRSITAPNPAKIDPSLSGATIARVMPSARLSGIEEVAGLTAGATSIAAWNGLPRAAVSLVSSIPSDSTMPIRVKPATMPGVTHLPPASTLGMPAGTATDLPAAITRPSRTTTVPPSIGAEPSPMTSLALVIATDCARSRGREERDAEEQEPLHFTSPEPGWPSSKSDTGLSFGLAES